MVYNRSDVAVTTIGMTRDRFAVVDFTFPAGYGPTSWMSRAPRKIPAFNSLMKTMDIGCWISSLVSFIFIALALILATRVGAFYGVRQPDVVQIAMTTFGMLNAEEFPTWFQFERVATPIATLQLIRRGRAGNLLLLTWSTMGMILMFGFICNLRAIFMKEEYEAPLDTAEDIVKSGKTVYMATNTWYKDFLQTSTNEWNRRIAREAKLFIGSDKEKAIYRRLLTEGNTVVVSGPVRYCLIFV